MVSSTFLVHSIFTGFRNVFSLDTRNVVRTLRRKSRKSARKILSIPSIKMSTLLSSSFFKSTERYNQLGNETFSVFGFSLTEVVLLFSLTESIHSSGPFVIPK